MRYVYLEDGKVVLGPKMLPLTWNNISNFNVLDDETLRSYGWYPHRFVDIHIESDETSNSTTFLIEGNEVVEYQQKRKKTESELQDEKSIRLTDVVVRRDTALKETDWTQLPDVPFSEERRQKWAEYRQALRDITQYTDPDEVIWPQKPE